MKFKIGDKVRVLRGTLKGQEGVIYEASKSFDWRVQFADGDWGPYSENELEAVPVTTPKFNVGDKVRTKYKPGIWFFGIEGVVSRHTGATSYAVDLTHPTLGYTKTLSFAESELEAVPMEIDRSENNRPRYNGANVRVSRNWAPSYFGSIEELNSGVFIKNEGKLGITIAEAKQVRDTLTDIIDRIEHDRKLAEAQEQNSNAARKAELLRKTDELIKQANALRKEAEGL